MNRRALERLLAAGGIAVAALLLVGGALLSWAHSYIHDEVHSQLSAQKIYFPKAGSDALKSPEVGPYLNKYAGQQLVTGTQAKAWADHYIAVHLNEMTGGQTYAQLSTQSLANPNDQQLAAKVQTVFRGETLRGLLLNAYAFDTMGDIADIGAIVAYNGAGVFVLLSILGFLHAPLAASTPPGGVDAPARERISA